MSHPRGRRPSRRQLLRGALAGGALVTLGLPWLEALAAGGGFPKRFGLFFWGNGNRPERWTPSGEGEGAAWALSDQLAPLAPVKSEITVVSGTSVKLPNLSPHYSGACGILSGAPYDEGNSSFTQPTLDQVIAGEIGGRARLYSSLQTAATDTLGDSWSGPGARNPAESDPYALYQRLFGDTFVEPGSGGLVDPRLGLRRSVLDAVSGQLTALRLRVGAADQIRLDQHLTGVRELEQRLARLQEDPPELDACVRPTSPDTSYPNLGGRPQIAERNQAMAQLLAMAMACDQTRVFAHFLSAPINDVLFEGASAGHHDLTHNEPGEQPEVHAITVQCVEHLSTFLQELRSVPEGDGTLLDSCAVLATSEVSLGQTHSLDEMPIVIAGRAGGALRTDLHVRSVSAENASKVLLSLIRAMDIPSASFGIDEARVTESFTEIEA
ncbi:MAG TPA: DUF1552 domain-containing protein [Deltaproteobacteria bacterium]|nr:DUF1552 domain-containing protein [Deltaproteobacteria bacterium]